MPSVGTLTCIDESDKYKKCSFLNAIQHLDIYGKVRASYTEKSSAVTSVSSVCSSFTNPTVSACTRLNDFSITTKMCEMRPGNDILSKKRKKNQPKSNFVFGSVMLR